MMENIRSFVAIEIPEALKGSLGELLGELKTLPADVKWVRPEGIHATLKFLGTAAPETLERLSAALAKAAQERAGFELHMRGIGCFPSLRNPRVVWAGLVDEEGAAAELRRRIETAAREFGFPSEDRPFHPHLTLGRVRSPKGRVPLVRAIERHSGLELGSFRVERVILFRSDLRPEGAVYRRLKEFPLK